MAMVHDLARFAVRARYEDLSPEVRQALKVRVLDSLACAVGALDGEPVRAVRRQVEALGGEPLCTLIGGGRSSPDRCALYNGALVRYLDFNDTYLAPGESFHPSDNLAPVLACAEYADAPGREFLTALAVAYQVQIRLAEVAPVRRHGLDHTTHGAYSVPAGCARALGLDAERTAHAIAIAGTSLLALRATRAGAISHWKGLAFAWVAFGGVNAVFLAREGVTGPEGVLDGQKGLMEVITGPFALDWEQEGLSAVLRTSLKKHNAEFHAQTAIDALLALREEHRLDPTQVERIEVETFEVAHRIIGGGEEGNKYEVRTREDADHSLPYILAVAMLDGQVQPEQYAPERIRRPDVQALLRRVAVRPREDFSRRFPREIPTLVRLVLRDGRVLEREQADFEGFYTRPLPWEGVVAKWERLAHPYADPGLLRAIPEAVADLDTLPVRDLTALLARVGRP